MTYSLFGDQQEDGRNTFHVTCITDNPLNAIDNPKPLEDTLVAHPDLGSTAAQEPSGRVQSTYIPQIIAPVPCLYSPKIPPAKVNIITPNSEVNTVK